MITRELQATLNLALNEAVKRRHEFLTLEHLLYAMLHDQTSSEVLLHCGADLELLRHNLEEFFRDTLTPLPRGVNLQPEQTAAFERVIDRALMQAQSSNQEQIDGGNILASLFEEHHSHAKYLLEKQGINKLDVLSYISHGISKIDGD
ncbi:MAG TPA: Clp protease N-terminal domain-containing protein, partial [Blastocatellia bacterium]|nr:Clp protease N-terminal domain-containing protein [Blastocatellia bacterium]